MGDAASYPPPEQDGGCSRLRRDALAGDEVELLGGVLAAVRA